MRMTKDIPFTVNRNDAVVDEPTGDEKTGKTIPAIQLPMGMKVDWVRHYKPTTK